MQRITRDVLIEKAASLLSNGTVQCVLGWKKGEFVYDITPAVFTDAKDLEENFVWNDFCGANFSKYLVAQTRKSEGKILVFLKPCDTYSFNQLMTEHRFDREKVYAIGVPCKGMVDIRRIRALAGEEIASVTVEGDTVTVHIGRLRKRFEGWGEFEIENIRGLGYKAVRRI